MKEAFNSFDEQKKGWFNKEDLKKKLYDPEFNYNQEDFDYIFKEAFPNGIEKITYDDFKQWMEILAT